MNTILIIDDETKHLSLLFDLLSEAGYKVLSTSDSHKAINRVKKGHPQLILLDIMMPKIDGFKVCQQLKLDPETQDIPIIFITNLTETQNQIKCFELGAVDYITKPIQCEEVLVRVASHLKIYQLQQQLQERNHQLEEQAAELSKNHKDLLSILNQLEVGTLITNADGRIIFISESCVLSLNQNNAFSQKWEDVLPFDTNEKEQLQKMMMKPLEERTSVSLTWQNQTGQHYWLKCDIRNDPREPKQHIFYFYDQSEIYQLRQQLSQTHYGQMVGNSEAMLQMYDTFERIAQGEWTVMIEGETGVGKELVARSLHAASTRQSGPFIAVNCGSLNESLLASEFFGHCKGAFTGAIADHTGFFEAAAGGTLFLDEIGELSLSMQTSLLRAIEKYEITRLGESKTRKVDVRILTATHKDLEQEIRERRFREDLFYRLNVTQIRVPKLRERLEDIPSLVEAFMAEARVSVGKIVNEISMEAMQCLQAYHWPGNVRELKHAITHAIIHSRQAIIRPDVLPPKILESINHKSKKQPAPDETIEFEGDEETRLRQALEKANGNSTRAAQLLGIGRSTFYRHLEACGISPTKSGTCKK